MQFDFIEFAGKFHPVVVHFPIALVAAAGLSELFFARTGDRSFAFATRFMLHVAAVSGVIAALLGFAAARGQAFESPLQFAFSMHRILGVCTAGLLVLAAALAESAARSSEPWQRTLCRVVLVVSILTVGFAVYYGGSLVYGPDHFSTLEPTPLPRP